MKILALTSSTQQASIALGDESRIFEKIHSVPRGHTEFMNAALADLLDQAGWKIDDLDLIAVDQGPGSFTGLRVSVSVARSLCYLLAKPAFVGSSLDILAESQTRPTVAGLNAFKNLIFCSLFAADSTRTAPLVLSPPDLESWLRQQPGGGSTDLAFVGDAWEVYMQDWTPAFRSRLESKADFPRHPGAAVLLRRALRSKASEWTKDWKSIAPLYLRDSAAEENLRAR